MARTIRPRATAALAVAPATVTDRTAPAVLGLEPRAYRALVARAQIPHVTLGRRVVARVDDVLAALDRLASAPEDAGAPANDSDDEPQNDSADAVLARLGRRVAR